MVDLEKALVPFLISMMLVTGVCNTLLTKYQDNQCVRRCDDPDPEQRVMFEQPVFQTVQMFIGEMGSWLVIGILSLYRRFKGRGAAPEDDGYQPVDTEDRDAALDDGDAVLSTSPLDPVAKIVSDETRLPLKGWRVTLLALPAIFDICGTTLMNVGLFLVVASIYQMTRGALVLFVGLFSIIFLRRKLHWFQWFALFTVVAGVAIVGLAGWLYKDHKAVAPDAVRTTVGVLLIAGAQVFSASQFVVEEFILHKYALEPIRVVGWEGIFGFLVTVLSMIVLYFAVGRTEAGRYGYFDLVEGWRQMTTYPAIGWSSLAIMFSVGGFNYFGLSVTRKVSATSRSVVDTCRTLFIWIVSLFLGWESFKWLQVLGFALLVYGTFLFNGLVRPPLKSCVVSDVEDPLTEDAIDPQ